MATKYSELELAINTLVTEFHKAADSGATINTTQFQTLVAQQLPAVAKEVQKEEALAQLLQQMGVQNGQDVSFETFWTLVHQQAVQLFGSAHKQRSVRCGCLLQ